MFEKKILQNATILSTKVATIISNFSCLLLSNVYFKSNQQGISIFFSTENTVCNRASGFL